MASSHWHFSILCHIEVGLHFAAASPALSRTITAEPPAQRGLHILEMQPQGSIIPSIKLTLRFLVVFSMIEEEGLLLLRIRPFKSGLKQDTHDSPKPVVMGSCPLSSAFFTHTACREKLSSTEVRSAPTPTSFHGLEEQREALLMNPTSIKLRSWWDLMVSPSHQLNVIES